MSDQEERKEEGIIPKLPDLENQNSLEIYHEDLVTEIYKYHS